MFQTKLLKTAEEKRQYLGDSELEQYIPFLDTQMLAYRDYIVALEGDKVVGVVCMTAQSSRVPNALGIGFISTHCHRRNQGVAKSLVQALFAHARSSSKGIANTDYEPEGLKWLKPLMERAAQANADVVLHERN